MLRVEMKLLNVFAEMTSLKYSVVVQCCFSLILMYLLFFYVTIQTFKTSKKFTETQIYATKFPH